MSKAQTKIEKLLKELQGYADSAREEMTTIMSDGRYSAEYRRQLLQGSQSQWASIARRGATNAWKDYQKALQEANEGVARATLAKDAGIREQDPIYQRAKDEYSAVLRSNSVFGYSVGQKVADLAQQAQYSPARRAALAFVVDNLPALRDVSDPHMTSVRSMFRQWETEADAPRLEAMAELKALQQVEGKLVEAIYDLEVEHTGEQRRVFHPLTEWGRSVFGLTPQNMGLIMDRDDDETGFVGQADGIPSGVLTSSK